MPVTSADEDDGRVLPVLEVGKDREGFEAAAHLLPIALSS